MIREVQIAQELKFPYPTSSALKKKEQHGRFNRY